MRDRLEANHHELLAAIAEHGSAVEKRLDALEATVARLDERTKNSFQADTRPSPKRITS